jgi:hypothetical protein
VNQQKAAFRDPRASLVLLRELWTGHPSARPALIHWLRRLADDGRPTAPTAPTAFAMPAAPPVVPQANSWQPPPGYGTTPAFPAQATWEPTGPAAPSTPVTPVTPEAGATEGGGG